MEVVLQQRSRLGEVMHQIEILNGSPRCALDQVVDGADDHRFGADAADGDVAKIGMGHLLGPGQDRDEAIEQAFGARQQSLQQQQVRSPSHLHQLLASVPSLQPWISWFMHLLLRSSTQWVKSVST
mgnify:CR=1 FL=1